jgi:hypothetical protein
MSDDFGTVNVRRGDRAREIEVLRQHYRTHREALVRMIADAPTEQLAGEYQRLVGTIDQSLGKLDELEGAPSVAEPPMRAATLPGDRPLVTPPPPPRNENAREYNTVPPVDGPSSRSRVAIIVIAGLLVLGAIAWLILRSSGDRRSTRPLTDTGTTSAIVETSDTAGAAPAPVTPAAATAGVATGALKITPAIADYGTIRKGTRAVRQFEVTNPTASPITIAVARSQCRCLFYDYSGKVAAKGKETVTVTVDGAKAKAGALNETLQLTSKEMPGATTTFGVQATIK